MWEPVMQVVGVLAVLAIAVVIRSDAQMNKNNPKRMQFK